MLTLSQQEIKEIENYINEIPTKYGLPLINYLNTKIKQKGEDIAQEVNTKEEEKKEEPVKVEEKKPFLQDLLAYNFNFFKGGKSRKRRLKKHNSTKKIINL